VHRRDDACGLVQGVILHVGVEVDLQTVDPNLIGRGIASVPQGRDGSVDRDPAFDDQLLTGSTGAVAGACEETLETLGRHG
jgi:hypothetical protein